MAVIYVYEPHPPKLQYRFPHPPSGYNRPRVTLAPLQLANALVSINLQPHRIHACIDQSSYSGGSNRLELKKSMRHLNPFQDRSAEITL